MELLQFIFQDAAHFIGTAILLVIIFEGGAEVVKAFRRPIVMKTENATINKALKFYYHAQEQVREGRQLAIVENDEIKEVIEI
jgi:hypothetical protein